MLGVAFRRNSGLHVAWVTISYRAVVLTVCGLLVLAGAVSYFVAPNSLPVVIAVKLVSKGSEKLGWNNLDARASSVGPQQAHFTALDGTVRVKKANRNNWVNADFGLPLDKGDVVQTSSEGMAKVFFTDGTSYDIKPDSLIVIEESFANAQQQTQVAVQVTTGTVDLSTGTYSQGSSSQVIVAGATASFAPETSAVVHNDPLADEHEILLKKGSGQVTRNDQIVTLANYERVSFKSESAQMTHSREIGPPTLIQPAHMMPIYVSTPDKPVDFAWTPAFSSRGYRLRISRNPYFSSTVFDKFVTGTELRVSDLRGGTYYWVVTSLGAGGRESVESERNQFTIVLRANESVTLALELDPFIQHGHVIEIKGKTEPLARVMVNGKEVPDTRGDGSFSFFTPELPKGENVITITAQNSKGGVNTQQKVVMIE